MEYGHVKATQFWYQPQNRLGHMLAPLGYFYQLGARLRRLLATPYQAGVPVICVGNVVAGGAGKTPTALALAALLQQKGFQPAFVTRGYGGSQRGPLRVDAAHHSAEDVGDEALLLLRQAPVWIGRNRVAAIREAEKYATHIILDDGLQNPNLKPDVALLVMDGPVGLGNGQIIPAGPLREPLTDALNRITAVLVIGKGDAPKTGKPVLRAHLQPAIPADFPRDGKFFAFAGIGRPEKFYELCRHAGLNLIETADFPDHHPFSQNELDTLERKAREHGAHLLTTEKDHVRLPPYFRDRVLTFPVRLEFEDSAAVEKLMIKMSGQ